MKKVFIDGSAGTTGLRLWDRLSTREDLELIRLKESERKDPAARKQALNACDIACLCLPDDAAREAVGLIENEHVTVLDTSTAHRTAPGWVYGFPELGEAVAENIAQARRIAVPGCHASGFIALVAPLVQAGILPAGARLFCHSLTGYSGVGNKMIALYEQGAHTPLLHAPRQYALTQKHKHLPEMQAVCTLTHAPVFCPVVSDFYSGMVVTVPLFAQDLVPGKTARDICAVYAAAYTGPVVRYRATMDEDGFLSAAGCSGKDAMEITVCGNAERIVLIARYDNLGKGASGAALQCLNLVLGAEATAGLVL